MQFIFKKFVDKFLWNHYSFYNSCSAFVMCKEDITNLMSGTSDDGGEHSPGSIVSGESGLAHSGSIVDN